MINPYEFWWAQKMVELQVTGIIIGVLLVVFTLIFILSRIEDAIKKWRKK